MFTDNRKRGQISGQVRQKVTKWVSGGYSALHNDNYRHLQVTSQDVASLVTVTSGGNSGMSV